MSHQFGLLGMYNLKTHFPRKAVNILSTVTNSEKLKCYRSAEVLPVSVPTQQICAFLFGTFCHQKRKWRTKRLNLARDVLRRNISIILLLQNRLLALSSYVFSILSDYLWHYNIHLYGVNVAQDYRKYEVASTHLPESWSWGPSWSSSKLIIGFNFKEQWRICSFS